jgi:DNA replicative helicase MCM subunit Mcm2 (Cdc46/Mcm family)
MIGKKKFLWLEVNFKNFLFNFFSVKYEFKYRKIIEMCANSEKTTFEIFLKDLYKFNYNLYTFVIQEPLNSINCFEFLVSKFVRNLSIYKFSENKKINFIQVLLIEIEKTVENSKNLNFEINKLISLKINTVLEGKVRTKITKTANFYGDIFKKKIYTKNLPLKQFKTLKINNNSYISDEIFYNGQIQFVDYQFIKGQEEIPKINSEKIFNNFTFLLERNLVNQLNIGSKYIVTGIYILDNYFKKFENLKKFSQHINSNKNPVIKVLGVFPLNYQTKLSLKNESLFLSNKFLSFARSSSIYNWIYSIILPNIFNRADIKQGIACVLFGGKNKFFSNNYRFRSEINILFLYNQPEINSEFFNFIKTLIGIDFNSEFYDNLKNISSTIQLKNYLNKISYFSKNNFFSNLGFFCIENFEKLNIENKIKIMELIKDQTYYNETEKKLNQKSIKYSLICSTSQKFFQNTILHSDNTLFNSGYRIFSKFDLFFCLNKPSILNNNYDLIYQPSSRINTEILKTNIYNPLKNPLEILRRYIEFVRKNFSPIMSKIATELLKKVYTHLRMMQKNIKVSKLSVFTRINLNKLETIIRISESISKMRMSNLIDCNDILDAVRIIQKSIFTIDCI